jgi:hypothetical protein
LEWSPHPPRRRRVPVCPLGALARLKPFEAYVSLANGTHPPQHVWLEPLFVQIDPAPAVVDRPEQPDPLAEVIARVRGGVVAPPSSSFIFDLMNRAGGRILMPLPVWRAAVEMCEPSLPRELLLEQVTSFFMQRSKVCPQGLAALPTCWLRGLPYILEKRVQEIWQGKVSFVLAAVAEQSGALGLEFAHEAEIPRREREMQVWDVLRVSLNCHLYPSLWRPLSRRHWRHLHATRPELRASLRLHASAIGGEWF